MDGDLFEELAVVALPLGTRDPQVEIWSLKRLEWMRGLRVGSRAMR